MRNDLLRRLLFTLLFAPMAAIEPASTRILITVSGTIQLQ